jgi:hypothetical protein
MMTPLVKHNDSETHTVVSVSASTVHSMYVALSHKADFPRIIYIGLSGRDCSTIRQAMGDVSASTIVAFWVRLRNRGSLRTGYI